MSTIARLKELRLKAIPGPRGVEGYSGKWYLTFHAPTVWGKNWQEQELGEYPRLQHDNSLNENEARLIAETHNALSQLIDVVEAAEATTPFCQDPVVTAIGLVPCDVCPKCILRLRLAALENSGL